MQVNTARWLALTYYVPQSCLVHICWCAVARTTHVWSCAVLLTAPRLGGHASYLQSLGLTTLQTMSLQGSTTADVLEMTSEPLPLARR